MSKARAHFAVISILVMVASLVYSPHLTAAEGVSELERRLQAHPEDLPAREKLAREYQRRKQWQKIVDLLNPNTDVATARGFMTLAAAYHELKDYQNLVRVLTLLTEKRPKDYHLHYMLGDARLKLAKTFKEIKPRQTIESEAIESLRTSIRLKQDFRVAHQGLVNYFLSEGLNHEAREQIADMLKVFGPKADLHMELCRLFAVDGFLPQAIKNCNTAIRLSPTLPDSYMYLAQAFYDQKESERAEETLIHAAKKFPKSEFVQYGAGKYYLRSGNFPVAVKYLKKAVANRPGAARSQISLAKALFESNQAQDALAHFAKACELDSATQADFLAAATKLRLKGDVVLGQKYNQQSSACKKN